MNDAHAHQTPCVQTLAIQAVQSKQDEMDKRLRGTEGDLREIVSEIGLRDAGPNGHSVLGRLVAGERRDKEMAEHIAKIEQSILTKEVMERTIKRAAAWVVGAIAFVGGPPAVIATVKMLWKGGP